MQVTLGLTEIFTRIGCHHNNPIILSFLNITYEAKLITITTENPPEKKIISKWSSEITPFKV